MVLGLYVMPADCVSTPSIMVSYILNDVAVYYKSIREEGGKRAVTSSNLRPVFVKEGTPEGRIEDPAI
jgi:hypothetical protein